MLSYRGSRLKKAYKRPPDLTTAQWGTENINLTKEASPSMPGPLRFDRTPWIEEILNDYDRSHVAEYNIMASTQVGKTTIIFCAMGKEMDTGEGQMQLTIPTEDGVTDYMSAKFDPFVVESIKSIKDKIILRKDEEKKRLKGAVKELPGVKAFILGNTAGNRRSKSVTRMFIDEAALFGSGHIDELIGRMKFSETLCSTKAMIVSSRKHKGDEMEVQYDNSYCKKELQICCPHCNEYFYPRSDQLVWMSQLDYKTSLGIEHISNDNDYKRVAAESARLQCDCGGRISVEEVQRLVVAKKVKLVIVEGSESDTSYGYKLNALASGLSKYSTIVEKLLKAGDDYLKLQTIYQDYFNEIYERRIDPVEANDLLLLGNGLDKWVVPEDTIRIYMGIDTQKDHFWWEFRAYCYGKESHTITQGRAETFDDLEKLWELGQNMVSIHGEVLYVDKLGIDRRGYNDEQVKRTEEVDTWVRKMTQLWRRGDENRIYATEGEPKLTGDKPYTIQTRKDDSDNRIKVDIKVMKLSNIYLKTSIRTAMANTVEMRKSEHPEDYEAMSKFFVNQTTIDADAKGTTSISYTRQISAEVYDHARDKNGKLAEEKSFINPKQADNHFFDTSSICEAFAQKDQVYMERKPDHSNLSEALKGIFL
jgi:phage terminase large subunit GpA-like protein